MMRLETDVGVEMSQFETMNYDEVSYNCLLQGQLINNVKVYLFRMQDGK